MELPLAVDIADRVTDAVTKKIELDIAAEAEALVAKHPEAEVTRKEVATTLEVELKAKSLSDPGE